ncbi:hypothetical protein MTO96_008961 [Rhipicephalus appendiculatus]
MRKDANSLHHSDLNTYQCVFGNVRAIFADVVSVIGPEVLLKDDDRLRQITPNFHELVEGLEFYVCGDLHHLSSIKAIQVYRLSLRQKEGKDSAALDRKADCESGMTKTATTKSVVVTYVGRQRSLRRGLRVAIDFRAAY